MDLQSFLKEWPKILAGLYTTVLLVAASLILGLALAVPMGILRNSRNWMIKGRSGPIYTSFVGTPCWYSSLSLLRRAAAPWG